MPGSCGQHAEHVERLSRDATLTALGQRLGVAGPQVALTATCVDSRRQWRHAGNVWHNSMIRSMLQTIAAPVTGLARVLRPDRRPAA
jgi:hypothetical protein